MYLELIGVARLAGLEPATPALEGRFQEIVRISEFLSKIAPLSSVVTDGILKRLEKYWLLRI